MTIERPMFPPVVQTRRHLLTVAAGGAVAAAIPTAVLAAAPVVDPIYAAIDRHRDLVKKYEAAVTVRARCKDFGTITQEDRAHIEKLNDALDEAHLPLDRTSFFRINKAMSSLLFVASAGRFTGYDPG